MAVAGPVGPTQLDPRIEEELRKRSALAATGMKEIKGSEQKLSVIKEAKLNLNPHNQKYLENFEKNVDKIKVYESNDKKMAVLVDLENQRLMEMTFMGPKKTNVERWEVKKEAQPAQVTQIIPVKDLSSQISWDMGEKAKLSSQQEVKLKESLTASATASQIKEPLPAIIEPKELDAKPMPKVSNDNCLKAATSLIDEISKSVEKLQGRMESEFQSKQKGVLSQSGVESVRVLLGVPGAKLTTFEAYRSDMNDKRVGLTYVKSLLGKGKTIESMQKMTVKDFKDEKEFGKFSNGLKFLGSNLKDKNRIYNYLGDINSHLNFFDDAMDFYAKGGNKESFDNANIVNIASATLDFCASFTSAKEVAILSSGIIVKSVAGLTWKGLMKLYELSPAIQKEIALLDKIPRWYHTTNLNGLQGIAKSGAVKVSGNQFYKAAWTSKGSPILSKTTGYDFALEFKNLEGMEKGCKKIFEVLAGKPRSCYGFADDIALNNWTGQVIVSSPEKISVAKAALQKAGMDMGKVSFVFPNEVVTSMTVNVPFAIVDYLTPSLLKLNEATMK